MSMKGDLLSVLNDDFVISGSLYADAQILSARFVLVLLYTVKPALSCHSK